MGCRGRPIFTPKPCGPTTGSVLISPRRRLCALWDKKSWTMKTTKLHEENIFKAVDCCEMISSCRSSCDFAPFVALNLGHHPATGLFGAAL